MAKAIRLKKLLRRDEVAAVVAAVSRGEDAVVDAKGRLLAGPAVDGPSVPVTGPGGTTLGQVTGPHAPATAETLTALVRFEQERRELADEVLDMYREVNLLYALGEVLATARDRDDLAAPDSARGDAARDRRRRVPRRDRRRAAGAGRDG